MINLHIYCDAHLLEDYEYRDDKPPKRPGSSSSLVAYVGPQLEKNTMYYLILKKTTFYIYLLERPKNNVLFDFKEDNILCISI